VTGYFQNGNMYQVRFMENSENSGVEYTRIRSFVKVLVQVKLKFILEKATKAQMGSRVIALLFL
jgi:membrane-bound lytic murein transglycosylase MltF